jgi:glutathione peroxidase
MTTRESDIPDHYARDGREGKPAVGAFAPAEDVMRKTNLVSLLGVALSLAVVGCADAGSSSDETVKGETMRAAAAVDAEHAIGTIDHTVTSIEGDTVDLRGYRGRPMLIVNTASKCGFTKQYDTLQQLYETFGDRGLAIIGFPSNDFGNQEPGTEEEIASFCRLNYGVTFPMMAKVHTKGPNKAPIYRTLTEETADGIRGEIRWNFTKFLVAADGTVVARFEPSVDPMSDDVVTRVEALLGSSS